MTLARLYLLLVVVGVVVPGAEFVAWLSIHGLDVHGFFRDMTANGIARFFAWDVVISALVVILVACADRHCIRHAWLPVVGTLCIGVSCGLPLYLCLRQRAIDTGAA
ncbi:MAG: DUF2834 domain-containing protein [Proteobacteria bacterium]|nr:DUF2834 domain-containing protein [Pseudomonadota bacterium]